MKPILHPSSTKCLETKKPVTWRRLILPKDHFQFYKTIDIKVAHFIMQFLLLVIKFLDYLLRNSNIRPFIR